MQSACGHICQCGNLPTVKVIQQPSQPPTTSVGSHINGLGECSWPTKPGFAAPLPTHKYTSASASNLGTASYQQNLGFGFELFQAGPTDNVPIRSDTEVCSASPLQCAQPNGLWGSANFVALQDSLMDFGIDFDVPITLGPSRGCVNDYPVSPQDALLTPSLVHSPPNARTLDASPSASAVATAGSASASSVPATPSNVALLELETQPNTIVSDPQTKQEVEVQGLFNTLNGPQNMLGLANAFEFASSVSTQGGSTEALQFPTALAAINSGLQQPRTQCLCSVPLKRTPTNLSSLHMPESVATPAPGWLDPKATPNEMIVGPIDPMNQMQHLIPTLQPSGQPDGWAVATMTTTNCSRYEPYRNPSIASTASSSSQTYTSHSPVISAQRMSFNGFEGGTRRRSLTTGSLSGPSSSLVDRVRVMSVARSQSPIGQQQQSVTSPSKITSTGKHNSLPRIRTRPSAPALSSAFSIETKGTGSLTERRKGGLRSPLSGLFVMEGSQFSMHRGEQVQPSPTMSDFSQDLSSPTSLVFAAAPPTPLEARFWDAPQVGDLQAEDFTTDAEKTNRAKIAVHHHRTKLQRNLLNEVVTLLQGAYKHCRRQILSEMQAGRIDQCSSLVSELAQLDSMHEELLAAGDGEPCSSVSGMVVADETREMRKNRQKAESKMRMRRKEVAQFAALTTYAKIALPRSISCPQGNGLSDGAIGHSLVQVFLELRQDWTTLIALEKRLFHTVRVKLGLQELMVKKLLDSLESTFVSV